MKKGHNNAMHADPRRIDVPAGIFQRWALQYRLLECLASRGPVMDGR